MDGKGPLDDAGAGAIAPDDRESEDRVRQEAETRPLQPSSQPRGPTTEDGEPPRRVTEVQGWDATPTQPPSPSEAAAGASRDDRAASRDRIEERIGRGGMGEVLSARDQQIGRLVAIKRLRSPDAPLDIISRFMREARIQGRLDHPAIPPVHELWCDERGQPFFAMKQLSGITLSEVLVRLARGDEEAKRRFTRQHLLRAFVDVCLAIEFAHTRAVVHRDLKPANVMLGEFGDVYVLDWGVARVLTEGAEDAEPVASRASIGNTMVGVMLG